MEIPLKERLEARLAGIGYKDGQYIKFSRLLKILESLRWVYVWDTDGGWSVLVSHAYKRFPDYVRIVSIAEKPNQIWRVSGAMSSVEMILAVEVGVAR